MDAYDVAVGSPGDHPLSPLDPEEGLTREEVLARGRGGLQLQRQPSGWRKMTHAELTAAVAVPALILLGVALGQTGAPLPIVVISVAMLIVGLAAFALSGRNRPQL